MAASKGTIRKWLGEGKERGATHVIVMCDTFDHDDYPVFVKTGEDVRARVEQCRYEPMQTLMEVYDLSMDLDTQMSQLRAMNY